MLIVKRHHTNPYFNLAAEEYFLKDSDEDIFMLWRNEPAIIVGSKVNLKGLGTTFSKAYYVTKVTHSISTSGFKTTFEVAENSINVGR